MEIKTKSVINNNLCEFYVGRKVSQKKAEEENNEIEVLSGYRHMQYNSVRKKCLTEREIFYEVLFFLF